MIPEFVNCQAHNLKVFRFKFYPGNHKFIRNQNYWKLHMRFIFLIFAMLIVAGASACKSTIGSNVQNNSAERNKDGGGGGY